MNISVVLKAPQGSIDGYSGEADDIADLFLRERKLELRTGARVDRDKPLMKVDEQHGEPLIGAHSAYADEPVHQDDPFLLRCEKEQHTETWEAREDRA